MHIKFKIIIFIFSLRFKFRSLNKVNTKTAMQTKGVDTNQNAYPTKNKNAGLNIVLIINKFVGLGNNKKINEKKDMTSNPTSKHKSTF
jgi:hypothetical protein